MSAYLVFSLNTKYQQGTYIFWNTCEKKTRKFKGKFGSVTKTLVCCINHMLLYYFLYSINLICLT